MDASIATVNLGRAATNPHKDGGFSTGIDKRPVSGRVEVRSPGPQGEGLGSGLVGDFIGDGRHHGGDDQAIYAFQREDLDRWEQRLG
ncbi:MAG: MOSC domain-containing protein, partial [Rhodoglobus sp.]